MACKLFDEYACPKIFIIFSSFLGTLFLILHIIYSNINRRESEFGGLSIVMFLLSSLCTCIICSHKNETEKKKQKVKPIVIYPTHGIQIYVKK